jgi:hypothetical protein
VDIDSVTHASVELVPGIALIETKSRVTTALGLGRRTLPPVGPIRSGARLGHFPREPVTIGLGSNPVPRQR